MNEAILNLTSGNGAEINFPKGLLIPPPNLVSQEAANKYNDPYFYINREISWLEFNRRVLEEAQDNLTPIMEKLKFASIFSSNLDEYFMIRIGGLVKAQRAGKNDRDPSGKTVQEQLDDIAGLIKSLVAEQYICLMNDILPEVRKAGIFIHNINELDKTENSSLDDYFNQQVLPALTPLAVDSGDPFPFVANLSLNLMVIFTEVPDGNSPRGYSIIEIPSGIPRLIRVNTEKKGYHYILLEDLVRKNISSLFPGIEIKQTISFRVTRNRDYDFRADEVVDLPQSIEKEIKERSHQIAVRLEIESNAPKTYANILTKELNIDNKFTYEINGPINICDLLYLYNLPVNARYKDPPFNPRIPLRLANKKRNIFSIISEGDVLLYHPYDSFAVVMDFLNHAADDPNVLSIKQTFYRIGKYSPIIGALCRAAENGKKVTAVVELKARFDEECNIDWAHRMQRSGVNVVFGFPRWKTHCKATLVERREGNLQRKYVHVSSGNYNAITAKQYTDIGLLTCNEDFGADVNALFNILTGSSTWSDAKRYTPETLASMFRKFMVSPVTAREAIMRLIDREIQKSTAKAPGRIIAKLNAVTDPGIIHKLYEASQAGVQIDLIARGICCLRPGVPGLSENIRVISILDRYLEHSRIYYFYNGGYPEVYAGSSDCMERNFGKRTEIIYPIEDNELKSRIINEILFTYLNDNVKARVMQTDGSYIRRKPQENEKLIRSQSALIAIARKSGAKSRSYEEPVKNGNKKLSRSRDGKEIIMMEAAVFDKAMPIVDEISRACDNDPGHNVQVTTLALTLFDALKPLHKFGAKKRQLLEIAGRLHDIGWSKTVLKQHHKLSGKMILELDIPGFSNNDKLICSLVARYHTKALPNASKHHKFASLSAKNRDVIEWLSAILRVADALDSSHTHVVKRIKLKISNSSLIVHLKTNGDCWDEIRSVHRKQDLLVKKIGRNIEYQC
jgi:polyphosphate kinase